MLRLAIAASGNGSNFENIVNCSNNNTMPKTKIECLIVDKENAFVIERAKKLNIKTYIFNVKLFNNKAQYENEILKILQNHKIEFFVLAGYMRIIGDTLLNIYNKKIINIHPSFLPYFPGKQSILDAYNSGVLETGVSVHYVNNKIDGGEIIIQKKILFNKNNTLSDWEKEIHLLEYKLYPEAINLINPYL